MSWRAVPKTASHSAVPAQYASSASPMNLSIVPCARWTTLLASRHQRAEVKANRVLAGAADRRGVADTNLKALGVFRLNVQFGSHVWRAGKIALCILAARAAIPPTRLRAIQSEIMLAPESFIRHTVH